MADYERSTAFDALDRLVLRLADGMTDTPNSVADEVVAGLLAHFDHEQLVELTARFAWEQFRARFNRTLRLPSAGLSDSNPHAEPTA